MVVIEALLAHKAGRAWQRLTSRFLSHRLLAAECLLDVLSAPELVALLDCMP